MEKKNAHSLAPLAMLRIELVPSDVQGLRKIESVAAGRTGCVAEQIRQELRDPSLQRGIAGAVDRALVAKPFPQDAPDVFVVRVSLGRSEELRDVVCRAVRMHQRGPVRHGSNSSRAS